MSKTLQQSSTNTHKHNPTLLLTILPLTSMSILTHCRGLHRVSVCLFLGTLWFDLLLIANSVARRFPLKAAGQPSPRRCAISVYNLLVSTVAHASGLRYSMASHIERDAMLREDLSGRPTAKLHRC